jgi:pantetheine-phosphate adenylyltransferase
MTDRPVVAIFPGSFDPVTLGHEDVVRSALRFADRVIVAVAHRSTQEKRGLFSVEERLALLHEVFRGEPRVEAAEFEGLLVEFARRHGATLAVRGLRAPGDFEYELRMALMNRALHPEMETVFLPSRAERAFLSASLVREVWSLGGDVSDFVSPPVREALRRRREETAG